MMYLIVPLSLTVSAWCNPVGCVQVVVLLEIKSTSGAATELSVREISPRIRCAEASATGAARNGSALGCLNNSANAVAGKDVVVETRTAADGVAGDHIACPGHIQAVAATSDIIGFDPVGTTDDADAWRSGNRLLKIDHIVLN